MCQFTAAAPGPQDPDQVSATGLSQQVGADLADLLIRVMDAIERLSDRMVDIEIRHAVSLAEVLSRQQRLYELLTPRFNLYFRDESEARMAWACFNILRDTPDAPFPPDVQKPPRRTLRDFEA